MRLSRASGAGERRSGRSFTPFRQSSARSTNSTTAEIALIENIQRQDLNAIEEAEGYRQLIKRHGHTQDEVGKLVHKSRSHVTNLLRLLDLPEFVRVSLMTGDISMGHARAVAAAEDPEALTRLIVARDLSVRATEEQVRREKSRPGPGHDIGRASARNAAAPVDADLAALERQLGDILGLKVAVTHKGQGGAVTFAIFKPRAARHDLPAPER